MMWDNDWGNGQWIAMALMMLLFWGLIVVGIVALVRSLRPERPAAPAAGDSARRILDERFARGELDADEYAQRRSVLDRAGFPPGAQPSA